MLLFDNIIFSTFIPQILMVLGFVSCVTAPYFYPVQQSETEIRIETKSSETVTANYSQSTTFRFADYQVFEKDVAASVDLSISFFNEIKRYIYPLIASSSTLTGTGFPLVTRPPPFFLQISIR